MLVVIPPGLLLLWTQTQSVRINLSQSYKHQPSTGSLHLHLNKNIQATAFRARTWCMKRHIKAKPELGAKREETSVSFPLGAIFEDGGRIMGTKCAPLNVGHSGTGPLLCGPVFFWRKSLVTLQLWRTAYFSRAPRPESCLQFEGASVGEQPLICYLPTVLSPPEHKSTRCPAASLDCTSLRVSVDSHLAPRLTSHIHVVLRISALCTTSDVFVSFFFPTSRGDARLSNRR